MSPPDDQTPRDKPPRRVRYTLGSLLTLVAGLAVMLGVVAPFLKPPPPRAPSSHGAMRSTSINIKNCAGCHAGMPSDFKPTSSPLLPP